MSLLHWSNNTFMWHVWSWFTFHCLQIDSSFRHLPVREWNSISCPEKRTFQARTKCFSHICSMFTHFCKHQPTSTKSSLKTFLLCFNVCKRVWTLIKCVKKFGSGWVAGINVVHHCVEHLKSSRARRKANPNFKTIFQHWIPPQDCQNVVFLPVLYNGHHYSDKLKSIDRYVTTR